MTETDIRLAVNIYVISTVAIVGIVSTYSGDRIVGLLSGLIYLAMLMGMINEQLGNLQNSKNSTKV